MYTGTLVAMLRFVDLPSLLSLSLSLYDTLLRCPGVRGVYDLYLILQDRR